MNHEQLWDLLAAALLLCLMVGGPMFAFSLESEGLPAVNTSSYAHTVTRH